MSVSLNWRRFAGATAYYAIANGVFSGLPLLLLPWLAGGLGPAGYGSWVAFSVIVAGIVSLGGLCAHSYLILEWPKTETLAQRAGLALGSTFAGLLGVAISLPLVTLYLALAPSDNVLPRDWGVPATLLAAATVTLLVYQSIWQSDFRAGRFMLFRLLHASALAITTLAVLHWLPGSWQAVATVTLAVTSVAMVVCVAAHYTLFREGIRALRSHFRHALRFGLLLLPHSFGGVAMAATDKLLVGSMLSASELGAYGVAAQFGLALALLNDSVNRSYAPWLSRALTAGLADDASRARGVVRHTYAAFAVLMLLAVTLGATLAWLLPRVSGVAFARSGDYAVPICLGHGFTGMYFLVVNYVMFARRFVRLAFVSIGAGALNVALGIWWVSSHGAVGAAWAFAASQFVLFAGAWWLAGRVVPMPWFAGWAGAR